MSDPLTSLLIGICLGAAGLFLFWPEYGLFQRWQQTRRMTERVLSEDALKHIYHCEMKGDHPTPQSVAGALHITVAQATVLLAKMETSQLLTRSGADIYLSSDGRAYALQIIRAHRLWERYLSDKTGFAEAEWHTQAERYEHDLSPSEIETLAAQLGHPTHDPHGDPIPSQEGDVVPHEGRPLTTLAVGQAGRIVHLEDEPELVYDQLIAEELYPGQVIRVAEITPARISFWTDSNDHILAPIVAANITVVPLPEVVAEAADGHEYLSDLQPGETARVVTISPLCRGPARRRLLDLGVLPGTLVKAEMRSPGGDPTAYTIRGAVLALRQTQAKLIHVTREVIRP